MLARNGKGEEVESLPILSLEYENELEKERYEAAIERRQAYRAQMDALQEPPIKKELHHLKSLHDAQQEDGFGGLLANNLVRSNWERMYPDHENVPEKIFGGTSYGAPLNWR